MKLLVFGEGPNDVGKPGSLPESGTLQRLISLVLQNIEVSYERMQIMHLGPRRSKGGFQEKVRLAFREAELRNSDALVYVVDQDGDAKREEKLKKARDQQATSIPSAVGVAIKTIEAWLLADETAIAKAFSSETPSTTKNPEKLSDPKQILQGRLDKIDVWANYSEMYADLAGNTRIEVLRKRCPNGFAPFETELLSLFE